MRFWDSSAVVPMLIALQLAAAVVASEGHPGTLPFVTLDERLAGAAEREGFAIEVPGAS